MPSPKASYFIAGENGEITWNAYTVLGDAREAARAAGYDYRDYDFEVIRFNAPFFGAGRMSARAVRGWLVRIRPRRSMRSGIIWGFSTRTRGRAANVEYGDVYDIMGNPGYYQPAGWNAIHKDALGWMERAQQKSVTASGVYRLYAHDTNQLASDRTYVLRVRKDDERDYWIEKRQSFDFSDDMEFSGVLLYWDEWTESNSGTHLLDPVPASGYALPILTPFRRYCGKVFGLCRSSNRQIAPILMWR